MSEVLVKLQKKGGGNDIDILNPDVISTADMNGATTRNIAVTQMPRLIIYDMAPMSTQGNYYHFYYDVTQDKYFSDYHNANGYAQASGNGKPSGITSVTSSNVTVKNIANSTQYRTSALIYY